MNVVIMKVGNMMSKWREVSDDAYCRREVYPVRGREVQEIKVGCVKFQQKECQETFKWCGAAPQADDDKGPACCSSNPVVSRKGWYEVPPLIVEARLGVRRVSSENQTRRNEVSFLRTHKRETWRSRRNSRGNQPSWASFKEREASSSRNTQISRGHRLLQGNG